MKVCNLKGLEETIEPDQTGHSKIEVFNKREKGYVFEKGTKTAIITFNGLITDYCTSSTHYQVILQQYGFVCVTF